MLSSNIHKNFPSHSWFFFCHTINAVNVKRIKVLKMYNLTYSMPRSGEICSFNIKEHKLFHKTCHFLSQFGYSKTSGSCLHMDTGHNLNPEIRISCKIIWCVLNFTENWISCKIRVVSLSVFFSFVWLIKDFLTLCLSKVKSASNASYFVRKQNFWIRNKCWISFSRYDAGRCDE